MTHRLVRGVVSGLVLVVGSVGPDAATASGQRSPSRSTIVEIRVHGNQTLAKEEILALAGVAPGDAVGPGTVDEVERTLRATGRFEDVEVRIRYLSFTRTDEVALVIVVAEGPAPGSRSPFVRWAAALRQAAMVLPVADYTEGYGVTLGARTSFVELVGADTRLSIPATLGGTREVGVELDALDPGGPLVDRLRGGVSWVGREHPRFALDDDRTRFWARADRRGPAGSWLSVTAERAGVRFGSRDDTLTRVRTQVELDTRRSRTFPRDALVAVAAYEWLRVRGASSDIGRPTLRAEVYPGLVGQTVLAARVEYQGADAPLPPYEQPLLGGGNSVRGWEVGAFVGDRRATGSVELRVPLGSPLSATRIGTALFYDTGAVVAFDRSLGSARFRHGAGAGLWMSAAWFQVRVDLAHNLVDRTRIHVAAAVGF